MGLMSAILGDRGSRSTEDYLEISADDVEDVHGGAALQVHVAEIDDQQDVIAIKDAVYDGDIVMADITRLRTEDRTVERITDELRQVAEEVSGDIVMRGDDRIIVTPTGVSISRQKLNE